MNIIKTVEENVTLFSISGRLMGQPETNNLFDEINKIIGEGCNRIVLDLEKVYWINSMGIGSIMKSQSFILENNGQLILSGLNEKMKALFKKTQLSEIFIIRPNQEEAIAELKHLRINPK